MSNLETALDKTMYDMIFSDIPETNYKISNSFDRRMKKNDTSVFRNRNV